MAGSIFVRPKVAPINAGGVPYSGAKYTFYLTSTSTLASVYTDSALTTPHANPVVADANGVFAPIWLDPAVTYRARLTTSSDVLIEDVDPVSSGFTAAQVGAALYPRSAAESGAGITPTDYTYPYGHVRRYGAVGDGTANDTAAITAAIDSGYTVTLDAGTFMVDGGVLTANNVGQMIVGAGRESTTIKRRSAGVILAVTVNYVTCRDLTFLGNNVLTGDNVTVADLAQYVSFIDCNSYGTVGSCLNAGAASQMTIRGGLWDNQSASAGTPGIIIGKTGLADYVYYPIISGVQQKPIGNPIRLIGVGSGSIAESQIGGLDIQAGSFASVSMRVTGNRILGNIDVEGSSHAFSANAVGSHDITFEATSSGCSWIGNARATSGSTLTNSGSANSIIELDVAGSSLTKIVGQLRIDNGNSIRFYNAGGTNYGQALMSGTNFTLNNNVGSNVYGVSTGSVHLFSVNGASVAQISATGVYPGGTTAFVTQGAGTPEGAVTAPVGSLFMRTDGGASTTLYVKQSGTGNTGWVAK